MEGCRVRHFVLLFTLCLVFAGAGLLAAPVNVFTENWESGGAGWIDGGAGAAIVSDTVAQKLGAGNHAVATPASPGSLLGFKTYDLSAETDANWSVSWDFYQASNDNTREFMGIGNYTGGYGDGLVQLIALGAYNAGGVDVAYYNIRVTSGSVGWANSTIKRIDAEWVSMNVEQIFNPGDSFATVNFYVNNILGASVQTTKVVGINGLRVGSGLSNDNTPAYWDNIVVTSNAIPEPGSMLALGAGLIGLIGVIRRRKV